MRKPLVRSLLLLFGLLCGAAGLEIALRLLYPDGGMMAAHLQHFTPETLATFREDPECGYLPVIDNANYGPQGCLVNDYSLQDRHGKTRVLFIGDSATHRGRIVEALRHAYGDGAYEFWNAGVESFNTHQELVLYRRYNYAIAPDHVVLTFHNNDFQATPVVFHEKGKLKVYSPGLQVNPWLFEKSYLYRWAWPRAEMGDRDERAREVLRCLTELKELLAQQKVRFSVILLPILKPLSQWNKQELWSREQSLAYFQQLDLRSFDLLEVLEQAAKDGIGVEESGGDAWHPSPAVAERFAQELRRRGLLDLPR